ncbi:MAG TPA: histidinol-phosphate transaminase, partial [Treponemataceae bacterium]|nr:histidinol-phosphate transaminase [Treponemataceae bacterium]
NNDWSLNIDLLLDAVHGTGVYSSEGEASGVIFANPNAPTSLALNRIQIQGLLEKYPKNKVLVLDEAYVDFASESAVPLLNTYKNLVIVRTFSKSLSFAGMRLGYLVASKDITSKILTVKNSFNHFPVDILAEHAGKKVCSEVAYYIGITKKITKTREWFRSLLCKKGWSILASQTNFLLCKKSGLNGKYVYEAIKKEGFLVRYFDSAGIEKYVRISIGTQKQMEKLAKFMLEL